MRAILVTLIIFSTVPFICMRPYIGLLVYSWISFMSPHRLAYGFAQDFPFAMMIAVIFLGSWLMSDERKTLPIKPVVVLWIAFLIWMSVTSIFALEGPYGTAPHIYWWKRVMKIMLIPIVAIPLLTNRQRIDGLIWIMVLSVGFFAIKGGIWSLFTGGLYRVYGPPGTMIEENNALGVATVMIVPLVRYLQLQSTNKYLRRALLAAIPILIFSAIASHSRGGLLAMAAMGGFMLLKSRHKIAAGAATLMIVLVALSFAPQKWYDRMATIQHYEQDPSAMARINTWTTSFNLALDRPIFGGGFAALKNIPSIWEKYAPDPTRSGVAHSIFFQSLGEHGFPGLILFLSILYLTFRNGRVLIKHGRRHPESLWLRDLGAMTQVSLVGYTVGGAFLDLTYYDLYWNIVAMLVAARIIADKEAASSEEAPVAETDVVKTSLVPEPPRRSFLRGPGQPAGRESYLRR